MRSLAFIVIVSGCAGDPIGPAAPVIVHTPDAATPVAIEDAGTSAVPDGPAPLPEVPRGPASLSVHIPRGSRQPLSLVGTVARIGPAESDAGLGDSWLEVSLRAASAETPRFYLLKAPDALALPFEEGTRVQVEIDCRKGGWRRVCDATLRDANRRTILIVSGSGDERIASGWKLERGPVATSEVHPGREKSIEHTHSLVISREGRSVTVLPHLWQRFELRGESWLVQGYEVVWEGVRPPDAANHRAFSLLRER